MRGLRVAATHQLGGTEVHDDEIVAAWQASIHALADLGATVTVVDQVFDPLRPAFEAHWKAGFAATLRTIPKDRWEECDPGFVALAKEGLDVPMSAFGAAMASRAALIAQLAAFHQTSTCSSPRRCPPPRRAPNVTYHSENFDRWDHAVPFTVPFNLTGQPAASVPAAVSRDNLPIGIQVVAARWREDLVLRAARALESALGFSQPHARLLAALG